MGDVPEEALDKPSRRKGRDPAADKAVDNARQRKIASNSSDKAARRNAPLIKASANRSVRRATKVPLSSADHEDAESAQAAALHDRTKQKTWGSINAADHRAERSEERRVLDETAALPDLPRGRRRASVVAASADYQMSNGKK